MLAYNKHLLFNMKGTNIKLNFLHITNLQVIPIYALENHDFNHTCIKHVKCVINNMYMTHLNHKYTFLKYI